MALFPGSTGFRLSLPLPGTKAISRLTLERASNSAIAITKSTLDGYNQMDMLTGRGPSKRHEIFYVTEGTLGAVRLDDFKRFTDQPNGWLARR
jgi:hypothetical protein